MLPSRLNLLQAAAIVACGLLLIAVFNWYPNYGQLNLGISTVLVAIAVLAFRMSYPVFGGVFVAGALLYGSLLSVSLTTPLWISLDVVSLALIGYFVYRVSDSHGKGRQFEDYVTTLFPQSEFVIEDRTKDSSRRLKRRVESDMYPDLTLRNSKTGERFSIECKWRGQWARGTGGDWGLWWRLEQTKRYLAYAHRLGIPVFVALGIGGRPGKPREVYFIDTTKLKSQFLTQTFVRTGRTPTQFLLR